MKKTYILLLTTILLSITGCGDKKPDETVKISEKNDSSIKTEMTIAQKDALEKEKNTFILTDNNESNYTIYINNKNIEINATKQKIVVLNFFSTWCNPCQGQIPYMSDLNKKYDNKILLAGILVNDNVSKDNLKIFKKDFGINYFISNSSQNDDFAKVIVKNLHLEENYILPLTVLFKNGKYYSHYEGAVPIEMLNHDIKNAMSKE